MADLFDETQGTTSPVVKDLFDDTQAVTENEIANAGDFIPGVKRGVQNLQAMTYGAGALAGGGLKKLGMESVGQAVQDFGMEGYNRNVEEAKQYPKKNSFKDIYTGNVGDGSFTDVAGGAIDWAQGTLGELVPSMVEAAVGAAIGTAIAPGAGTAVGGLAGRTILKKGIEQATKQAMKQGVGDLTEAEVKKQITRQILKKAGGKAGLGAAVMPIESGGMYADLLESHGVDAPETALLFGGLAASLEFFGGNSKLVDVFVDSLAKGATGTAKKSAKEILSIIPQEALQEGGQELFGVLNTVANTDEKLLTTENVERLIESMAAGAIGGAAGAGVQALTNTGEVQKKEVPIIPREEAGNFFGQEAATTENYPGQFQDEQAQAAANLYNQDKFRRAEATEQAAKKRRQPQSPEVKSFEEAYNNYNPDLPVNTREQGLRNAVGTIDQTLPDTAVDDANAFLAVEEARQYNQFKNTSQARAAFPGQQYAEAQPPTEYDLYDPAAPGQERENWFGNAVDTLPDDTIENIKTALFEERARRYNQNKNNQDARKQFAGTEYAGMPSPTELDVEADIYQPSVPVSQAIEELRRASGVSIDKLSDNVLDDALAYLHDEQARKYNKDKNNRRAREQFVRSEMPIDDPINNPAAEIDYAEYSPEFFDELSKVDVLTTRNGTAYKNREYLEGIISELPNSESYDIIEGPDGFTGVKNKLRSGPNSSFKNEPQDRVFPQFPRKGGTNIFPQFQTTEESQNFEDVTKYDGEKDGLHYYTIQSGPAEGATFAALPTDPTEVNKRFQTTQQKFTKESDLQVTENQEAINKVKFSDIQRAFPGQEINQSPDGTVAVQFKNGKGLTIKSIQSAGQDLIRLAIETGQMSKNGKILGITTGNEILLDENFADNKTLWHENKHVLDNLGMITAAEDSLLNKEFNKLRKANKLEFALSTHEDSKQRMVENRANMFAQIMVNREQYRNTPFGKVIQRVIDFFNQLLGFGKQTISGLAREVESGKIYERKVGDQILNTTVPQNETTAQQWYSSLENAVTGFQQKIATPDQWKGMIKNYPGVKQEELDWIGLNDWLNDQQGKVTKDDLANFIRENNVQLEEVVKENSEYQAFRKAIIDKKEEQNNLYSDLKYELEQTPNVNVELNNREIEIYNPFNLDLTLYDMFGPQKAQEIITKVNHYYALGSQITNDEQFAENFPIGDTQYSEYQLPGGKNYKELLITSKNKSMEDQAQKLFGKEFTDMTAEEFSQVDESIPDSYKSGHWEELNILTHIRFNERTDLEGNKVLFLEEVQSDWHQEGRKEGYQGGLTREQRKKELIRQLRVGEITRQEYNQGRATLVGLNDNEMVPDAPFKKAWPMLAMKRMVRYAAENGFDKIAWPSTPEQVAQIENWGDIITEETNKGISYFIRGNENVTSIVNRYLQDIPRMLNKEFNRGKWGKAKVEVTEIPDGELNPLTGKFYKDGYPAEINQQLSLPITDRMRSKALREGMPMFQVAEAPEQKISEAEYRDIFNQKNNLVKKIAQTARMRLSDTRLLADRALGSISTRLKNVDEMLSQKLRWLDFDTNKKVTEVLKIAKPILDTANGAKNVLGTRSGGMTPEDRSAWNWARLQADKGKVEQLAQKYGMTEQLSLLRDALNNIRAEAKKVGYDVGFIDEYWPRVIKDREGFLQATEGISQDPVFTQAFREQAKKLGITQEQFDRDFPDVKADIISNIILGNPGGIGGPGNIKERVFDSIPKEYAKYYMDADAALMQYIYSMTKKIEARKFFGKVPKNISALKTQKKKKTADKLKYQQMADLAQTENPQAAAEYGERITSLNEDIARIDEQLYRYQMTNNYKENIGSYVDDLMQSGRIQKKDEKLVKDILESRFNEHGTTGVVNAYKNLSYIDTMGSPLSAITQIGDLAWAMYVGKVWTPRGFSDTMKNLSNAILNKSNIKKEDIGIERIAQEFADGTTLGNAVSTVFKMVGLEKIDSIGKEVLINNALDQYKRQAASNPDALIRQLRPTFGRQSQEVIQDLLAGTPSDNAKMLLYSRLLDFQPVALSEMPEIYLTSGNGRVFYMLKTYTLKQFDVFRKEVIHNLKSDNPQQKVQGIANMISLMSLLTLANAGADEIKDFMLGKETKFSDNAIENFLTMGGASRFVRMQISKDGFGSALTQQILPPMKFINSVSKDLNQGYNDYVAGDTIKFDHARIIDSIPVGGKLAYWHYGRGSELKQSIDEQEFAKVGKDAGLFKKQLENSQDKRLFIQTNLDRFKQMKLQENFQAALNRNKAVINKLEKIPSTENVQTRLGQLKAQREQILKKYFEAAKTI